LSIHTPTRTLFLTFLILFLARPVWADDALLRSMLLPGSGQAQRGHYGRAAIFASAAVVSGLGVFITQIHYNRASERYHDAKRDYLALTDRLDRGELISYTQITEAYQNVQNTFDTADRRYKWRNAFLVTLVGSYVVNIADLVLSGRSTGENEKGLTFEFNGESMRIMKSVRF
jgi:hypothetical protein